MNFNLYEQYNMIYYFIIHGQLVNTVPHVSLTGWLLTGPNNVNKQKTKKMTNNPFMAVHEIKKRINFKNWIKKI